MPARPPGPRRLSQKRLPTGAPEKTDIAERFDCREPAQACPLAPGDSRGAPQHLPTLSPHGREAAKPCPQFGVPVLRPAAGGHSLAGHRPEAPP